MTNWLSGYKSRRANKRRRHVVNSSSNFVFRGKYKQLEVCPYHIQIVFDLSLIWFERQVLIAIIHLLLLLPLARKWLIASSSCCSWLLPLLFLLLAGGFGLGFSVTTGGESPRYPFRINCFWLHLGFPQRARVSTFKMGIGMGNGNENGIGFSAKVTKALIKLCWWCLLALHARSHTLAQQAKQEHAHVYVYFNFNLTLYVFPIMISQCQARKWYTTSRVIYQRPFLAI